MPNILIVEDSPTQAALLRAILKARGFDVTAAGDGQAALRLLAGGAFDLIISDVVMPGMSGYELCRAVKEHAAHAGIPFILLTSLKEPMDIIRGLECGADNFLTKPYRPAEVVDRVDKILETRRVRGTSRVSSGVEIVFLGSKFTITSEREQILD